MMATVAIPAAMKVTVATSERCDNRLTPQTPWPLVQPLPMRVSESRQLQKLGNQKHSLSYAY